MSCDYLLDSLNGSLVHLYKIYDLWVFDGNDLEAFNMVSLIFRKNFAILRIFVMIFVIFQIWIFSNININLLLPYYFVGYPSYAFIEAQPSFKYPLPDCDPFIRSRENTQFYVKIDENVYP